MKVERIFKALGASILGVALVLAATAAARASTNCGQYLEASEWEQMQVPLKMLLEPGQYEVNRMAGGQVISAAMTVDYNDENNLIVQIMSGPDGEDSMSFLFGEMDAEPYSFEQHALFSQTQSLNTRILIRQPNRIDLQSELHSLYTKGRRVTFEGPMLISDLSVFKDIRNPKRVMVTLKNNLSPEFRLEIIKKL